MIPKIICWLFGHKRISEINTGKYIRLAYKDSLGFGEEYWDSPIYKTVLLKKCPRCGVKL